jgi:hypothetical protein
MCLVGAAQSVEAPSVTLARGGKASMPVVVAAGASAAVKASAADLARYLGRMGGSGFTVVEGGDGTSGIVVGKVADFPALPALGAGIEGPFARERYRLRSTTRGLQLLGATDLAVSHAVWDLLGRLGYRQFFPGATWEVVPAAGDLAIAIDEEQSPSFAARRIWYNWGLWGYNEKPYHEWCVRNRAVKGFDLNSGHAYEAIIAANQAEFDRHPEYYALLAGKRGPRGDVKFCVANPGLRALVAAHAVRVMRAKPDSDSISMDPSDGGGWCECADCAAIGSPSDRVVTLANTVAEAINALDLGPKYVGMYAYNKHSAPPRLRVHPRVIASATTAFIGGGFTFDQVVAGWQAQGATIGVYDYLSVVDWDWNLPRGGSGSRPADVAASLARFHRQGARFYDAESGDCWGPCGLGYYVASRVLWDVGQAQAVAALTDDFLTRAFAGAKEPMREFYRLINADTQRRSPSDLLARMYRQLAAARAATTEPAVHARLDDLVLYTRHAELYYAHSNGGGSIDDVVRHAYRMRRTMMVHSYGLWARTVGQQAAHTDGHPLKNDTPFSADELRVMVEQGIAKHQPADPGFAGVDYSRTLVPVTRLKLPPVATGRFPDAPQDRQRYFVWLTPEAGRLDLTITVERRWANRMPKISLFSPLEVTLDAVASDESCRPDGMPRAVSLRTPHPGLHRIETWDGGDVTRIAWPQGLPITLESGIDTPDVASHFRGGWTLHCYVPKGTKVVGGWASRIANWAPRISGRLLDGDGRPQLDFATREDGWFSVPVPPGQDGRLWTFADTQGQRLLMTVPPYLARTAEELLLPVEVVEADAPR